MKRWNHTTINRVTAGSGIGQDIVYYIATYPDRKVLKLDGYQTYGFKTEEAAQAALDEIYEIDYYRERYPNLIVLSKFTYSIWHE